MELKLILQSFIEFISC